MNVLQRLGDNSDRTVEFISKINSVETLNENTEVKQPKIENMIGCLVDINESQSNKVSKSKR